MTEMEAAMHGLDCTPLFLPVVFYRQKRPLNLPELPNANS